MRDAVTGKIAVLLFGSGACALVYQVAWQREFRQVFGASTAASAAVLAIFIGGLGAGGLVLGRLVDRHPRPLALYAGLEAAIAATSALTPLLLTLVRHAYVGVGGTTTLGLVGGTIARLLLAALVLAVPTTLMGGTLPAAARAALSGDDSRRRGVAVLYGANTLGAVAGSVLSTFALLEVLGTRRTLWVASLVNVLLAVAARRISRGSAAAAVPQAAASDVASTDDAPPARTVRFVVVAAAIVGFGFFLLEMVWYRMLGPLLGGTVFTFGLILAVALAGIGAGGLAYALLGKDRPATLGGLSLTCLLEAGLGAAAYALGDRLALLAIALRPLGGVGFGGYVVGWVAVTGIVVFPVAFVAGVQFPLLIGLFGRGRTGLGRQVGVAYAANTVGAMAGALAGGFGLLPLLSAPGCWRLATLVLVALGVVAAALSLLERWQPGRALVLGTLVLVAAAAALLPAGPTAAWRHGQVGIGAVAPDVLRSPNALRAWLETERRSVRWEADGVESSVAIGARAGSLYFAINGKVDGNARADAPTQVMAGLVGAILHPAPKKSLVIGLGTGESAGWIAAVPGMERVDVVELEPAVLEVARACADANRHVLEAPNVHITVGDARETLLTSRARYDLVVSEPSNPYRAGIAGLFTREFYEGVAGRLEDGGEFLQWVQAYDVDSDTVRSIYATLHSVFPYVETWQLRAQDLLLVASMKPLDHAPAKLRARVAAEPYRSALVDAWRIEGLEGLLAHHLARPSFADQIAAAAGDDLNTDDLPWIEFGFARSLGESATSPIAELSELARRRGQDRPEGVEEADVDWGRVARARLGFAFVDGSPPAPDRSLDARTRDFAIALEKWTNRDLGAALALWKRVAREPENLVELELAGESLAEAGDEAALPYVERLRTFFPAEADAILGRLRLRQGRVPEAAALLEQAFGALATEVWPSQAMLGGALGLAVEVATRDHEAARRLHALLMRPFAVAQLNERRMSTAMQLAQGLGPAELAASIRAFEPHVPWQPAFLALRRDAYAAAHDPLAARAADDLRTYLSAQPAPLDRGLP